MLLQPYAQHDIIHGYNLMSLTPKLLLKTSLLGNVDRTGAINVITWKYFNRSTTNGELSFFGLLGFFYLITWIPTSCGPPETSPQSTPDLAAAGVRSGPPLIPGEESRCCARCWSHGPTAASIRLKCRTGQPWRCAATSPVARLSAELTEQRSAHSKHTNQLLGKSFTCHPARKKKKKKEQDSSQKHFLKHTSPWVPAEVFKLEWAICEKNQ